MTKKRLAGLTAAEFLRRHWQKRPLLARGAFPGLGDFLQRDKLFELVFAGESQVQADAIEVVVYRLRKKLPPGTAQLVTLRGLGYLLKEPA